MTERKLPINLEGLWNNPNELFTVRYKDINSTLQTILAKKIKQLAKQYTIRKANGPTPEIIKEALQEINPIIFSEHEEDSHWYREHRTFGTYAATYLAGYRFQKLCQAIYFLTCRKKALTPHQIMKIAMLTTLDWTTTEIYINQRLNINTEEENERITPIEDIGIEDIHRAGQNVTNQERNTRNTPSTPDENYNTPRSNIEITADGTVGINQSTFNQRLNISPPQSPPHYDQNNNPTSRGYYAVTHNENNN